MTDDVQKQNPSKKGLDISYTLSYYKRRDVAQAMSEHAFDKEIGIFFGERFGKRPDIISYPKDVLLFAQKRATSFHCSEERWKNPMNLYSGISKNEMDELRKGWDFILDIDCPNWEFSRLITQLLVDAIRQHNIKSVSVKFSGNKGFHIGIPFEAFPKTVNAVEVKTLFPEGPRRLAQYLLDYTKNFVKIGPDSVSFNKNEFKFDYIKSSLGLTSEELFPTVCARCGRNAPKSTNLKTFDCLNCGNSEPPGGEDHKICSKCRKIIKPSEPPPTICVCKGKVFKQVFNPLAIVQVDTILIAPRHMYRMPYSLHEKSGLASVPVNPLNILEFSKDSAKPENMRFDIKFLAIEGVVKGEAADLLVRAFDFNPEVEDESAKNAVKKKYEIPEEAIPESCFPPCIHNIFKGLEDGRKRSLFVLINFLRSCGWTYENIEERLHEWNKQNKELLRETNIKGHVRYHKQTSKSVLPPNCKSYYEELRVCDPDELCARIKNPVSYARIRFENKGKNKSKNIGRNNAGKK